MVLADCLLASSAASPAIDTLNASCACTMLAQKNNEAAAIKNWIRLTDMNRLDMIFVTRCSTQSCLLPARRQTKINFVHFQLNKMVYWLYSVHDLEFHRQTGSKNRG